MLTARYPKPDRSYELIERSALSALQTVNSIATI